MTEPKQLHVAVSGKTITFETGKLAKQANAAVTVRCGDTLLLTTVCAAGKSVEDVDFLPLRVDYQEKFSSAGKTLGGFIKREGRPSEKETLVSRLIDRPIRPFFEDGYQSETQILAYVFSYDGVNSPDPLAICGASAALVLSDIPFIKPIAAVRVGLINNEFIINPTVAEQVESKLDLLISGSDEAILMIEGHCEFLTEEQMLSAIEEGHSAIKTICQALSDWQKIEGKEKNREFLSPVPSSLVKEIYNKYEADLKEAFKFKTKAEREFAISAVSESLYAHYFPKDAETAYSKAHVSLAFKKVQAQIMRAAILKDKKRVDGRSCEEIRPISIEQSLLPRTHGSSLFTRGETQSLAVATLGPDNMGMRYEDLDGDHLRRFYMQYSFPPYSVGEVGRMGGASRREIGHGKLAEKALLMTMPSQESFPYVVRLESNIVACNGSSSMASICGGCLAMMDAGVPIKHPIAGIAMGLILEGDHYAILSDILGTEDALGDMDFKVAGSEHGITAFQLDIKIEGITPKIMQVALNQAKQGRIHILQKMLGACPKTSNELSKYAPRIETVQIKPSKIGIVIGPSGKQIRSIIETTGVQMDINDSGLISISSTSAEGMQEAKDIIARLTAEVEVGKVYKGKVVSVVAFGAFVEVIPGKEGLCHISELAHRRIQSVDEVVKEGDLIEVKVLDINDRGQVKLSHKVTLPAPAN